ncbi:MAG: S26 family signal peptidase [Thermoplasmata archaeon]|nr:S26 family signal peptidase [Thermoplasmata archaeon]
MVPTLLPDDHLLVDPEAYRTAGPQRGDLVVLQDPEVEARRLVKRVDGLPGDFRGTAGTIPTGSVYVLGIDPSRSRDSRSFGPVPIGHIVGRAWFRYRPPERRGPLPPATVK